MNVSPTFITQHGKVRWQGHFILLRQLSQLGDDLKLWKGQYGDVHLHHFILAFVIPRSTHIRILVSDILHFLQVTFGRVKGLPSTGNKSSSPAFADIFTTFFFTVLGCTDSDSANEAVTSKKWANEQQNSRTCCKTESGGLFTSWTSSSWLLRHLHNMA